MARWANYGAPPNNQGGGGHQASAASPIQVHKAVIRQRTRSDDVTDCRDRDGVSEVEFMDFEWPEGSEWFDHQTDICGCNEEVLTGWEYTTDWGEESLVSANDLNQESEPIEVSRVEVLDEPQANQTPAATAQPSETNATEPVTETAESDESSESEAEIIVTDPNGRPVQRKPLSRRQMRKHLPLTYDQMEMKALKFANKKFGQAMRTLVQQYKAMSIDEVKPLVAMAMAMSKSLITKNPVNRDATNRGSEEPTAEPLTAEPSTATSRNEADEPSLWSQQFNVIAREREAALRHQAAKAQSQPPAVEQLQQQVQWPQEVPVHSMSGNAAMSAVEALMRELNINIPPADSVIGKRKEPWMVTEMNTRKKVSQELPAEMSVVQMQWQLTAAYHQHIDQAAVRAEEVLNSVREGNETADGRDKQNHQEPMRWGPTAEEEGLEEPPTLYNSDDEASDTDDEYQYSSDSDSSESDNDMQWPRSVTEMATTGQRLPHGAVTEERDELNEMPDLLDFGAEPSGATPDELDDIPPLVYASDDSDCDSDEEDPAEAAVHRRIREASHRTSATQQPTNGMTEHQKLLQWHKACSGSRVIEPRVHDWQANHSSAGIMCHVSKILCHVNGQVAEEGSKKSRIRQMVEDQINARKHITQMIPQLVAERRTNNHGLTYMKFRIMPIETSDNLIGYEESAMVPKPSNEAKVPGTPITIQFDGGAGWSVISYEYAKAMGLVFLPRASSVGIIGFDGSVINVEYYTVVALEIDGVSSVTGKMVTRRFLTQALITPGLHVDFILGSNIASEHNIVVLPDRNQASIFRGGDMMMVPCLNWTQMQRCVQEMDEDVAQHEHKLTTNAAKISTRVDPNEPPDAELMRTKISELCRLRGMTMRDRLEARMALDAQCLDMQIVRLVMSNPKLFFHLCKGAATVHMTGALVILAKHYCIRQLTARIPVMLDIIFDATYTNGIIGPKAWVHKLRNPEMQYTIQLMRMLTAAAVFSDDQTKVWQLAMHTESMEAALNHRLEKEAKELKVSNAVIEELRSKHCTDCKQEWRPEDFPVEYWPWVFDTEKEKVKERWEKFDIDLEGKAKLIKDVVAMDCSKETEARRSEAPLFIAQALANMDRFGHPDKWNQPRVKGHEFTIELTDDQPYMARYQKFDAWQARFLYLKMRQMEAEGRVERSTSPWNSRLSLVMYYDRVTKFQEEHKDNAVNALHDEQYAEEVMTFYRLTTDFRNLNQRTRPMCYPLPSIAKIIDECKGCNRFTTGDVRDAFWTVNMEQKSREATAFSTPDGHFHYCVMPQGAKNAATYWAMMIAEVFRPMHEENQPVIVYQDDVGNHEKALVEHMITQQNIYDCMRPYDMIFKCSKMHFNYMTQRILGHVLNEDGRMPDPKTIEAVTNLRPPRTLTELRSVIGLFQYAREYIENLAAIMQPLQDLVRKNVDIPKEWKPEIHGVAFEALKIALTTAPILLIPDISKPFKIQVDACRVGHGIGSILLQQDSEGVWRPCAYWSRSLSSSERSYSATMLECMALHDTILHWKIYLRNGHQFNAVVDHYALVYMVVQMSSEQQNHRLLQLCLDLQGFNFSVTHQAGIKHIGADAVSRLLRNNEEPYVRDEDVLRDDWGPLTEAEKSKLHRDFDKDALLLIETINAKRERAQQELEEEREALMAELLETTARKSALAAINQTNWEQVEFSLIPEGKMMGPVMPVNLCGECNEPRVVVQLTSDTEQAAIMAKGEIEPQFVSGCTSCEDNHFVKVCSAKLKFANINYSERTEVLADHYGFDPDEMQVALKHLKANKEWRNTTLLEQRLNSHIWKRQREMAAHAVQLDFVDILNKQTKWRKSCEARPELHKYDLIVIRGLAEYKSASLQYAINSGRLDSVVKRVIEVQLKKREMQRQFPSIGEMNTQALIVEAERLEEEAQGLERRYPSRQQDTLRKIQIELLSRAARADFKAAVTRGREILEKCDQWREVDPLTVWKYNQNHPRVIKAEAFVNEQWEDAFEMEQIKQGIICHASGLRSKGTKKELREARLRKADAQLPPSVQEVLQRKAEAKRRQKVEERKVIYAIEEQKRKLAWNEARYTATKAKIDQINQATEELRRKGRKQGRVRVVNDEDVHETALKRLVSEYDCLISQHYMCPTTQQLFQIVDVLCEGGVYLSRGRAIHEGDADAPDVTDQLQTLPILGEGGSQQLVELFTMGRRHGTDLPMPNCPEQWLIAQKADPLLSKLIEKLEAVPNSILPTDGKDASESKEYMYLARGMLQRRSLRTKETKHEHTVVRIQQEYLQIVVPDSLKEKVMYVLHDSMGHPGRNRTFENIKMRYYWTTLNKDLVEYVSRCFYCRKRKANNAVAKVPCMVYDYGERPNSRVHMDAAGPFPVAGSGSVYISSAEMRTHQMDRTDSDAHQGDAGGAARVHESVVGEIRRTADAHNRPRV